MLLMNRLRHYATTCNTPMISMQCMEWLSTAKEKTPVNSTAFWWDRMLVRSRKRLCILEDNVPMYSQRCRKRLSSTRGQRFCVNLGLSYREYSGMAQREAACQHGNTLVNTECSRIVCSTRGRDPVNTRLSFGLHHGSTDTRTSSHLGHCQTRQAFTIRLLVWG